MRTKVIVEMINYHNFMRFLTFFQHTNENGIVCHDHGTKGTEFVYGLLPVRQFILNLLFMVISYVNIRIRDAVIT